MSALHFDAVTRLELATIRQCERLWRDRSAMEARYGLRENAAHSQQKADEQAAEYRRVAGLAMPVAPQVEAGRVRG